MTLSTPIGIRRAFLLIIGIGARRWWCRMRFLAPNGLKLKSADSTVRYGTPRKKPAHPAILAFFAFSFVLVASGHTERAVKNAVVSGIPVPERPPPPPTGPPDPDESHHERYCRELGSRTDSQNEVQVDKMRVMYVLAKESRIARKAGFPDSVVDWDGRMEQAEEDALQRLAIKGPFDAFAASRLLPKQMGSSLPGSRLRFVLLLVFLFAATTTVAYASVDLAKPEWDLEWLWTTPAPAKAIVWARFFEYALLNPYTWIGCGPSLYVMLSVRPNVAAFPLAIAATAALAALAASVRIVIEFGLRERLAFAKNIQAASTILGLGALSAVTVVAYVDPIPTWFDRAAEIAGPIAHVVAAPLRALDDGDQGLIGFAILFGAALLAALGATAFAARTARNGLLGGAPLRSGRRGAPGPADVGRRPLFRGVVGKDFRLVLRDRNVLIQILVLPAFLFGVHVMVDRNMASSILADPRHAAAAAFGIGAYMAMICATGVLAAEAGSLWILCATPHRLDDILRKKTATWAAFAALYAAACLVALALIGGGADLAFFARGCAAVVGVVICAYLAAAIGSLGADPSEPVVARRTAPWAIYVYLLLSSLVAAAVYAPTLWETLARLVYVGLLAVAAWQKLRDRIPYILDPTEAPRPRVSFVDGMVASFAFLAVSGVFTALFSRGNLTGASLLGGYVAGGFVVATTMAFILNRNVSDFATAVGLRAPPGTRGGAFGDCVRGSAYGLAVGALGVGYLWLLKAVPALKEALQWIDPRDAIVSARSAGVVVLAIVAAPLLEEFIFRGLAFRGLERSTRPSLAVVGSATLFAFVHPLASVPPVFCLGVATALVFRRSGRLVAPIFCHAVYNACALVAAPLFDG